MVILLYYCVHIPFACISRKHLFFPDILKPRKLIVLIKFTFVWIYAEPGLF